MISLVVGISLPPWEPYHHVPKRKRMVHGTTKENIKEDDMRRFRPLGPRVLVKPLSAEEKTKSGIYLPESAKEKPEEGKVLEVGEGKWIEGKLVPLDVKKGDKIIFNKYGPDEIKINGEELLIVKEEDILGIIEE